MISRVSVVFKATCLIVAMFGVGTLSCALSAAAETDGSGVFELGEVVITAPRNRAEQNYLTGVSVLTDDDFKNLNAHTVGDVMEYMSGTDIKTIGKQEVRIRVRGFGQEDIQLLIDGVPAKECYFGTLDLSAIPIDGIAKIVVSKGASSILYGANTMGGVVNIITKKGWTGGKNISANLYGGQNGAQNVTLEYGNTFKKLSYWLLYSHDQTKGFNLSVDFNAADHNVGTRSGYREDGGIRDNSWYIRRTINAKVGYAPGAGSEYYLSFDSHDNSRGLPVQASRSWSFPVWQQWHAALSAMNKLTDRVTVRSKLYYLKHTDELKDDTNATITLYGGRSFSDYSIYNDYSAGGSVQAEYDLKELGIMTGALNVNKDSNGHRDLNARNTANRIVTPGWTTPEELNEALTANVALEYKLNLLKKMNIAAGISYDYYLPQNSTELYTDTGALPGASYSLNPQAGIKYYFTNAFDLYLSASRKTRFPHLKELFSQFAGGDTALKPQENNIAELGVEYAGKGRISAGASVFMNEVSNLITTQRINNVSKYVNLNQSRINGVELEMNCRITGWASLMLAYTYLDAKNSLTNTVLADIPDNKISLVANFSLPFALKASLQGIYTGVQYTSDALPRKIAGYTLANLKIEKHLTVAGRFDNTFYLQANNLFDTFYEEGSGPTAGRVIGGGCRMLY